MHHGSFLRVTSEGISRFYQPDYKVATLFTVVLIHKYRNDIDAIQLIRFNVMLVCHRVVAITQSIAEPRGDQFDL